MRICFLQGQITLISTWSTQQLLQTAFCWFLRTFQNAYFSKYVFFLSYPINRKKSEITHFSVATPFSLCLCIDWKTKWNVACVPVFSRSTLHWYQHDPRNNFHKPLFVDLCVLFKMRTFQNTYFCEAECVLFTCNQQNALTVVFVSNLRNNVKRAIAWSVVRCQTYQHHPTSNFSKSLFGSGMSIFSWISFE